MLNRVALGFALALALVVVACGDDDGSFPECEEIVEACHPVDPGSGPINACHLGAEGATSAQWCIDMSATCLALCAAAGDAGPRDAAGPDGGTSDAGR